MTDSEKTNEQLLEELARIRQENEQNKKLLDAIFKSTISLLAVMDKDFNFLRVNEAYAEADNRKVADFLGQNHFDFYPSDAKLIFEEVVKTKKPYRAFARPFTYAEHPERGETYWDWTLEPVLSNGGDVEMLIFSLNNVTERIQAEEDLNLFFELSPDVFMILGFDGTIKKMNDSLFKILGYKKEEFNSKTAFDIIKNYIHPDDQENTLSNVFIKVVTGKPLHNFINRFRCKDGTYKWFSWTYMPSVERSLMYAVARDITEQELSEQKLKLNEMRLEALLKLSEIVNYPLKELADFTLEEGIKLTVSKIGWLGFLNDDETTITINTWSKSVMDECTIIDKPLIFPVNDGGIWAEPIRQRCPIVINDYDSYNSFYKKGYPKGHTPLLRLLVFPLFEGERIVAIALLANKESDYDESDVKQLTLLMDGLWKIVLRKQAEEALHLSEERFYKAFQSSPVLKSIYKLSDSTYIDVNDTWVRIFGYTRDEVIGRTPHQIGLWVDAKEFEKSRNKLIQNGFIRNAEVKFRIKSGEVIIGLVSGEFIFLNGEKCILTAIVDITEKRIYEQEISRLDRLSLVGEMAAGIGHEIRNPLTTVRGFLQLLGGKDDCAKYKGHFDLMIDELDRANSIITEFLSLAKDKMVDLKVTNLNNVLKSLYPLIQADAIKTGISVFLILEEIPNLLLDQKEIRQVILNLTRNGIQAMPHGGTLTIKTFTNNEEVLMSVSDQGEGIQPEVLEKIGTPFFTTKDSGTGLGLATCYSIAARHKAKIEVDSNETGTTFSVIFKTSKHDVRE